MFCVIDTALIQCADLDSAIGIPVHSNHSPTWSSNFLVKKVKMIFFYLKFEKKGECEKELFD